MDYKHTTIENCLVDDPTEEDDSTLLESHTPQQLIFDLTITLKTRLKALDSLKDDSFLLDVLNRIGTMYMFSESKVIEKYLYSIVLYSNISNDFKFLASRHLKEFSKKGYECFDFLCQKELNQGLSLVIKVECMFTLLEEESFREKGLSYITGLFNDQNISCDYRYKTIIHNDKKLGKDLEGLLEGFIHNPMNPTSYKILACQYGMIYYKENLAFQLFLLNLLNNHNINYNYRADSCDIILRYGDDDSKQVAKDVLYNLSLNGQLETRTIYDNAQNVHNDSIEKSTMVMLGELTRLVQEKMAPDTAINEFTTYLDNSKNGEETKTKVKQSLKRIIVDRAMYGRNNMTLISIFIKVWCYMKKHEHREELEKRLVEELEDTFELCSSGYITRMLNSLSGITELGLSISFEDQIIANMGARLNKKINEIEDEDLKGDILMEMSIPSQCYTERVKFLKFFRTNISDIRTELYQDFKEYLSDTDFDLYTKKAIMKYQGDYMV